MKFNRKFFVFLISSIIIYATFLIVSDLNKLSENIVDFKIEFLPLILSLVSAGWVALYFRWILLLKNLKYSLPHKENFPIFLSGFALSVTPGKVGELLKSQLLKEKFDLPIKISAPVILIERFYNAIGIIIISIFGILVFDFSGIIILITTCLLILIFFILRSERLFHIFIQKISKISFLSKFSNSFMNSYDVIKESTRPKIFIISSILSAIYWIFESIAVYFILKSFGIDLLSIIDVIPTYATSIILGVASFIPAGLGVSESTLIGLLSLQGLTISTAVSLTIFIRLLTLWYSVFIGFIALKISGAFSINNSN
jgi:glycosyltransferase 2 family protein